MRKRSLVNDRDQLQNPGGDRAGNGKLFYFLTEFVLKQLLLFLTEPKPEDPKLIQ
jgi:hypothetical protein